MRSFSDKLFGTIDLEEIVYITAIAPNTIRTVQGVPQQGHPVFQIIMKSTPAITVCCMESEDIRARLEKAFMYYKNVTLGVQ